MDGVLDAILYRHTLDELRKQKETMPEEYQVGKYVVIKGERYYSIDTIKNILKEQEGGEDV